MLQGESVLEMPLSSPQWSIMLGSIEPVRKEEVAAATAVSAAAVAGQTASGCRAGQIHSKMWRKIKMDESSGR